MEHYTPPLDTIFQALSDPTRRAVLGRLSHGPASIGELARPFAMALPSFLKHIHALEHSGLIATSKEGRVRTCTLEPQTLSAARNWIAEQQAIWEARTDRLERFITTDPD